MYWDRDWDIILLLVNNFIKLYSENEICIKRPILGCFCLKILCDLLHMHEENMHHLFFRNRINLFVYVSMNSYTDIKSKFYLFNSYCLTKIARLYLTNHFMWFFFYTTVLLLYSLSTSLSVSETDAWKSPAVIVDLPISPFNY